MLLKYTIHDNLSHNGQFYAGPGVAELELTRRQYTALNTAGLVEFAPADAEVTLIPAEDKPDPNLNPEDDLPMEAPAPAPKPTKSKPATV